jgi:hypothetical protein
MEARTIIKWLEENYPKAAKAIRDGENKESVILEVLQMMQDDKQRLKQPRYDDR